MQITERVTTVTPRNIGFINSPKGLQNDYNLEQRRRLLSRSVNYGNSTQSSALANFKGSAKHKRIREEDSLLLKSIEGSTQRDKTAPWVTFGRTSQNQQRQVFTSLGGQDESARSKRNLDMTAISLKPSKQRLNTSYNAVPPLMMITSTLGKTQGDR